MVNLKHNKDIADIQDKAKSLLDLQDGDTDTVLKNWELNGEKRTEDLLIALQNYTTSTKKATKEDLADLKKKLEVLKSVLETKSANSSKLKVLAKDITILEKRIKALDELNNPPKSIIYTTEEAKDGLCKTSEYFPASTDSLKCEYIAIVWKVRIGNTNYELIDSASHKGLYNVKMWSKMIALLISDNGDVVVTPTKDLPKISFTLSANYKTKDGKYNAIALQRRIVLWSAEDVKADLKEDEDQDNNTWGTQPTATQPNNQSPTSEPVADDADEDDDTQDQSSFDYSENGENNMTAVVSDVSALYKEKAEHHAEEELRKEYAALGKFGFNKETFNMKNFVKRLGLYYNREGKKKKHMNEKIDELKQTLEDGNVWNPEMTAAADRHEKMFTTRWWNDDSTMKSLLKSQINIPEVDQLAKDYLTNLDNPISDTEFEKRFNEIIEKNPTIKKAINKETEFTASNILLKLRAEREYRRMINGVSWALKNYVDAPNAATYSAQVKKHVQAYVEASHKWLSPNIQKLMTAPNNINEYKKFLNHEKATLRLKASNMKIKLDVLSGWETAYHVNNKDKENIMYKIGNFIDKNPKTALALGIASTIWLGAIMWPAWVGAALTWLGGLKIAAKKAAHATKEQLGEEKRLTQWLDTEVARLQKLKDAMDNAPWYKRTQWLPNLSAEYKAKRQYELYGKTTQSEFMKDTEKLITTLRDSILSLNNADIQKNTADALARIDYYKQSGHNFLAQQNDKAMEENINNLQNLVIAWVQMSSNWSLADVRNSIAYKQNFTSLETGYTEKRKEFKKQRWILAAKYAGAYVLSSIWLQKLFSTWMFHQDSVRAVDGVAPVPGSSTVVTSHDLNQWIVDGFKLNPSEQKQLVDWFNTTASSTGKIDDQSLRSALRSIKWASWMSEHNFNIMKNDFMTHAFAMKEGGVYEVMANAAAMKLDAHNPEHIKNFAFLVRHGICNQWDETSLLHNLAAVKAGTLDPTKLPADMQGKMAEYCYMYLEKTWAGTDVWSSMLAQSAFHDTVIPWTTPVIPPVSPTQLYTPWYKYLTSLVGGLWIPHFANTFLEDVKVEPKKKKSKIVTWGGAVVDNDPLRKIVVDPRKQNIPDWYIDDNEFDVDEDDDDTDENTTWSSNPTNPIQPNPSNNTGGGNNKQQSNNNTNSKQQTTTGTKNTTSQQNKNTNAGWSNNKQQQSNQNNANNNANNWPTMISYSAEEYENRLSEVAKKYMKRPAQTDADIDTELKNNEDYRDKVWAVVTLLDKEWEDKVNKVAEDIGRQYHDFLKTFWETNDIEKIDNNWLGRAYRDIAKQYHYFSNPDTHADQKKRGYKIANPLTDSLKQRVIVDRMFGWHLYRLYADSKGKYPKVQEEVINHLKANLSPEKYEEAMKLLNKDPLEGRDPDEVKEPQDLSSKNLGILWAIIRSNYGKKSSTQQSANNQNSTKSAPKNITASAPTVNTNTQDSELKQVIEEVRKENGSLLKDVDKARTKYNTIKNLQDSDDKKNQMLTLNKELYNLTKEKLIYRKSVIEKYKNNTSDKSRITLSKEIKTLRKSVNSLLKAVKKTKIVAQAIEERLTRRTKTTSATQTVVPKPTIQHAQTITWSTSSPQQLTDDNNTNDEANDVLQVTPADVNIDVDDSITNADQTEGIEPTEEEIKYNEDVKSKLEKIINEQINNYHINNYNIVATEQYEIMKNIDDVSKKAELIERIEKFQALHQNNITTFEERKNNVISYLDTLDDDKLDENNINLNDKVVDVIALLDKKYESLEQGNKKMINKYKKLIK